jgi:hypothetical protein
VAEQGCLLSSYPDKIGIGGSNPPLSATSFIPTEGSIDALPWTKRAEARLARARMREKSPDLQIMRRARGNNSGGIYCFRTPNRWHYVTIASSLVPHSMHVRFANKLRALDDDAHDPWPTVYRANTRSRLGRLAKSNCFQVEELRMIEGEPSYGAAHALLFYPMMAYERLVNSGDFLSCFRVNILGTLRKPI